MKWKQTPGDVDIWVRHLSDQKRTSRPGGWMWMWRWSYKHPQNWLKLTIIWLLPSLTSPLSRISYYEELTFTQLNQIIFCPLAVWGAHQRGDGGVQGERVQLLLTYLVVFNRNKNCKRSNKSCCSIRFFISLWFACWLFLSFAEWGDGSRKTTCRMWIFGQPCFFINDHFTFIHFTCNQCIAWLQVLHFPNSRRGDFCFWGCAPSSNRHLWPIRCQPL